MREPKKYTDYERADGVYFMNHKLRVREKEGILYFTRKDWPIVYDFPESIVNNGFFNNLIDKGVAYDAAEIIEKEVNKIWNSLVRTWGCKMWSSWEYMPRRQNREGAYGWTPITSSSYDYRIWAQEYVTPEQLDGVRLNIENQIQAASRGWFDGYSNAAPTNTNVVVVTRGEYNWLAIRDELRNDVTYMVVWN